MTSLIISSGQGGEAGYSLTERVLRQLLRLSGVPEGAKVHTINAEERDELVDK